MHESGMLVNRRQYKLTFVTTSWSIKTLLITDLIQYRDTKNLELQEIDVQLVGQMAIMDNAKKYQIWYLITNCTCTCIW